MSRQGKAEPGLAARLRRIARIIEAVDGRCMAADGPVTPTLQEMNQGEISEIYALAIGRPVPVAARAPAADPYVRGKVDGYALGVVAGYDLRVDGLGKMRQALAEPSIISGWRKRAAAITRGRRGGA